MDEKYQYRIDPSSLSWERYDSSQIFDLASRSVPGIEVKVSSYTADLGLVNRLTEQYPNVRFLYSQESSSSRAGTRISSPQQVVQYIPHMEKVGRFEQAVGGYYSSDGKIVSQINAGEYSHIKIAKGMVADASGNVRGEWLQSTGNFTGTSSTEQNNSFIRVKDPYLGAQLDQINAWAFGERTMPAQHEVPNFIMTGRDAEGRYVSAVPRLAEAIRGASGELYYASATLSEPALVNAIIQEHREGTKTVVGLNTHDEQSMKTARILARAGVDVRIASDGKTQHHNFIVADSTIVHGSIRGSITGPSGNQTDASMILPDQAALAQQGKAYFNSIYDRKYVEAGPGQLKPMSVYTSILDDVAPYKTASGGNFRYVIDPSYSAKAKQYARAFGNDLSRAEGLGASIYFSLAEEIGISGPAPESVRAFDRGAGLATWGMDTKSFWSPWRYTFGPQMGNRGPIDTLLYRVMQRIDQAVEPPIPGEPIREGVATTVFSNTWDFTNNLISNIGGFYFLTKPFRKLWGDIREGIAETAGKWATGHASNPIRGAASELTHVTRSYHNFVSLLAQELLLPAADLLGLREVMMDPKDGVLSTLRGTQHRTMPGKIAAIYDYSDRVMQDHWAWRWLSTKGIGAPFEAFNAGHMYQQGMRLTRGIGKAITGNLKGSRQEFVNFRTEFSTALNEALGVTPEEQHLMRGRVGGFFARTAGLAGVATLYANHLVGEISSAQRNSLVDQIRFEREMNRLIQQGGARIPLHVLKRPHLPEYANNPLLAPFGLMQYAGERLVSSVMNTWNFARTHAVLQDRNKSIQEAIAGDGLWRRGAYLQQARNVLHLARQAESDRYMELASQAGLHDPSLAMQLVVQAQLAKYGPSTTSSTGTNVSSQAVQFSLIPWLFTPTFAWSTMGNITSFSLVFQGPVAMAFGAPLTSPIGLHRVQDPNDKGKLKDVLGYVPNTVTESGIHLLMGASVFKGVDWTLGKIGVSEFNPVRDSLKLAYNLVSLPLRLPVSVASGIVATVPQVFQRQQLTRALGNLELVDTKNRGIWHWMGADSVKGWEVLNTNNAAARTTLVNALLSNQSLSLDGQDIRSIDDLTSVGMTGRFWNTVGHTLRSFSEGGEAGKQRRALAWLARETRVQHYSPGLRAIHKGDDQTLRRLRDHRSFRMIRYAGRGAAITGGLIAVSDLAFSLYGQYVGQARGAKLYERVNNWLMGTADQVRGVPLVGGLLAFPFEFASNFYNVHYGTSPILKAIRDRMGPEFADPDRFADRPADMRGWLDRWGDRLARLSNAIYTGVGSRFKGTSFMGIVWGRADNETMGWLKSYVQPGFGPFSYSYASGLAGLRSNNELKERLAAMAGQSGDPLGSLAQTYDAFVKPAAVGKMWHGDSFRYQLGYASQMAMRQREALSAWALTHNNPASLARHFYLNPHRAHGDTGFGQIGSLDWGSVSAYFMGGLFSRKEAGQGFWESGRITKLLASARLQGVTGESYEIDPGVLPEKAGGPFDGVRGLNPSFGHHLGVFNDRAMVIAGALAMVPVTGLVGHIMLRSVIQRQSLDSIIRTDRLEKTTGFDIPTLHIRSVKPISGGGYEFLSDDNPTSRSLFYAVRVGKHYYTYGDVGIHISNPFGSTRSSRMPQGVLMSHFTDLTTYAQRVVGYGGTSGKGIGVVALLGALKDNAPKVNLETTLNAVIENLSQSRKSLANLEGSANRALAELSDWEARLGLEPSKVREKIAARYRKTAQGAREIREFIDSRLAGTRDVLEELKADLEKQKKQWLEDYKQHVVTADTPMSKTRYMDLRAKQWLKANQETLQAEATKIRDSFGEAFDARNEGRFGAAHEAFPARVGFYLTKPFELFKLMGRDVMLAADADALRATVNMLLTPGSSMSEWAAAEAELDAAKKIARLIDRAGGTGVSKGTIQAVVNKVLNDARLKDSLEGMSADDVFKAIEADISTDIRDEFKANAVNEVNRHLERVRYNTKSRTYLAKRVASEGGKRIVKTLVTALNPLFLGTGLAQYGSALQPFYALGAAADPNRSESSRRLAMKAYEHEKWDTLKVLPLFMGGAIGGAIGKAVGDLGWKAASVATWNGLRGGALTAIRSMGARAAFGAVARFVGGALLTPLTGGFGAAIGAVVFGAAADWAWNALKVDDLVSGIANRERKWETELPSGPFAGFGRFVHGTLGAWQNTIDYTLGRLAVHWSDPKQDAWVRYLGGTFATIAHTFTSPMNPNKRSYLFYQPENPGTSLSLTNPKLRFSPLWHGNMVDLTREQVRLQDQMMLGSSGELLRGWFHESTFGSSSPYSTISSSKDFEPSTWRELGPNAIFRSEAMQMALASRALSTQPILYGLRRRGYEMGERVFAGTLPLTKESGYRAGDIYQGAGARVHPLGVRSGKTHELSPVVTPQAPSAVQVSALTAKPIFEETPVVAISQASAQLDPKLREDGWLHRAARSLSDFVMPSAQAAVLTTSQQDPRYFSALKWAQEGQKPDRERREYGWFTNLSSLFGSFLEGLFGKKAEPKMVTIGDTPQRSISELLGEKSQITSAYGLRHHPDGKGFRQHHGIDVVTESGTLSSPVRGEVVFAGAMKGYGAHTVVVRYGDVEMLLGHNSKLHVKQGDKVDPGRILATMGNEGGSFGAHFHLETRKVSKSGVWVGEVVDPQEALREITAASLVDEPSMVDSSVKPVVTYPGQVDAKPRRRSKRVKTVQVSEQKAPEASVTLDNHKRRVNPKKHFALKNRGGQISVSAQYPDGTQWRSLWDNNMMGSSVEEALLRR